MRLHPLVHHAKFRAQPIHIVLDVSLKRFKVQAVLMQGVQDLLFECEVRLRRFLSGLFSEVLETLDQLGEILGREICDRFQSGRLEVFEASVVEDLAD